MTANACWLPWPKFRPAIRIEASRYGAWLRTKSGSSVPSGRYRKPWKAWGPVQDPSWGWPSRGSAPTGAMSSLSSTALVRKMGPKLSPM